MTDHPLSARRRKASVRARSYAVQAKRAYEAPSPDDGRRVLVDRIWPRGVPRDKLALDDWLKDVAPSNDLRRWFHHDPARWAEFLVRYRAELARPPASEALASLEALARREPLTLVFAARDERHNNAVALCDFIAERLEETRGRNDGAGAA